MEYQYLSPQHLSGFENYKYSSRDTSPLSVYVMHPFWNKVVLVIPSFVSLLSGYASQLMTFSKEQSTLDNKKTTQDIHSFCSHLSLIFAYKLPPIEFCPRWVAPNVLTFVGFLFTAGACLLLSIYDYEFYASSDDHPERPPIPRWVFLVTAIGIFVAYTLDGIDGKQARRTQTSGPLGELFDHGLDSWTAVLIPTCLYSVFGRTDYSVPPIRYYFVCWNVFLTFYSSHWEKYNTGVLFLPWGYDLSLIATTLVFLVTYLFGHEWWKFTVYGTIATGHVLEILFYLSSFASNLPVVLWNIYKSYRDRTGKMRSAWEANRPLVPVLVFLMVCAVWAYHSPSDIISRDPRAYYLMTGTIFSNICCRLIVAQMSNTRCDTYNWLLGPSLLCTGLSILLPSPRLELSLLYALWALSTLAHVHYGTCVVRQMCRHFRISCFQIKPRPHSE